MKKYIKSIFTSRKQLMLLSLMLVSGSFLQAQTVPDTVYVSFKANASLKMTYGQDLNTLVDNHGLNKAYFSYLYVMANGQTANLPGGVVDLITFKDGKSVKDILRFSEQPTVGGKQTINFVSDNLSDYFSFTSNLSPTVFYVSNRTNATLACALDVDPALLSVAARDTSRFYGDANPATPWSVKDFEFDGFVNNDTKDIFVNSSVNVLPDVIYSGANEASVPGKYTIELSGGKAANYRFVLKNAQLTVKQSPLVLAVPDSARLYDDSNISSVPGEKLVIVSGALKNNENLSELFNGDNLTVDHEAVSAPVNSQQKSDVGIYKYKLIDDAVARVKWRLSNYDIQSVAAGNYEVKKDTITITVFDAYKEVGSGKNKVKVMQKIYGEPNPDGYFYLTKRLDNGSSPSYAFSKAAEAASYVYATAEADRGFQVTPLAGYYDYEGRKATEKTDVNLKCKKPHQNEDSLYVAKVDNIDKVSSRNYAFKTVDGSFLINQRELAIWKVIVGREYGEANRDTTWTFEPYTADRKRGLTRFDAGYQTTTTPDDIIDVMPVVVVKPVAADNTLHAGTYKDTLQIKVVTEDRSLRPPFYASDRNYALDMKTLVSNRKTNDSVRLEVAKAPLIIHLDTIKRAYGSADPDFNNELVQREFISYEGFKLDESANSLDSTSASVAGNRIKTLSINDRPVGVLPVGTYELSGDTEVNRENINYEITIIGKACYQVYPDNSYVMVWTPLQNELIVGDLVRLNAVVKQGSTTIAEGSQITYESSDPNLIQVEKIDNIWYLRAKGLTTDAGITITARYHAESGQEEVLKSEVFKVVRLKNEADFNVKLGQLVFDYDGQPKAADIELTDLKGITQYTPIITYDGDPDQPVNAGLYNISIFVKHNGSELLVRKDKMLIKPREVTVTPKSGEIVYGASIPTTFDYTYTGFINGDDFKAASAPVVKVSGNITGAGNYTLYVDGGDPGNNYVIVGKTGTLSISKAPLTIKADTVKIVYGDAIPDLQPTFEGFIGNENPEMLNFIYTVKPSVKPENAGKYSLIIDCLSKEENNYDVKLVPGELIIAKADPNLQYDVETTSIMVGDSVLVYVTCDSPAPVAYSTENPLIAGYREHPAGVHVIGKGEGVAKLYFNVPESVNYMAYSDSLIFNVKKGDDVANESITLQGVGLYPTFVESSTTVVSNIPVTSIYVIDAAGKVQKAIKNPQDVIDLSQLRSGYYLVRIELANGQVKTVRIVKK